MASRAFGKSEINAVTTRIKVAQDLGNDGIKKVSETRTDIESAINEAIKPEWARVLHGIPVDEINSDKSGIRVNVLKEAGYTDVYSIYAASQQNLASVNGIGEVMSLRAKENATKIATDVAKNVKLRLSLDHKSDEYSRLVTAVAEHMRARENLPKCQALLALIPPYLDADIEKTRCAKSGIKWFFSGDNKKEEAQAAYGRLMATASTIDSSGLVSQIQGYPAAPAPSALCSIIGPISIAAAWNDFANRPIEYYQVLEEIAPERFNGEEDGYGLSDEIRDDVANTPVDLTGLNCTLRGYQIWGVKYILHQKRVLLGDEMGLGKTIQALAAMVSLRNDYLKEKEAAEKAAAEPQAAPKPATPVTPAEPLAAAEPLPAVSPLQEDPYAVPSAQPGARAHPPRFLVICPASVIVNWCREIEAKSDLRAYNLHDNNRDKSFETWTEEGGVAVTNYESLENHFVIDPDFDIDMIIVDEAHYIKNTSAKRSKNVLELCYHTERILFMTGTPLENNVNEMIRLMDYLQHDVAQRAQSVSVTAYADDFKDKISPVYYRRKRESVLSELPDLTDVKEWCDMTPEDERAYEDDVLTGSFMDVRRVSWRNEDYLNTSAKVRRLREIVEDAAEDQRKILVFSFFLDTLEKIRTVFGTQCVGVINGAVPVEERQSIVDAFEQAPAGSVLAAQIQSGGTGLNIQSASVVILCEPQYKPSTENQAIGRAHRMGQTRDVLVYRLLCPDTVDERMIEILEAKQAEFDTFADESSAAARDAASEQSGVDVNQNVIVGEKPSTESGTQSSATEGSKDEDPTATRPVDQPAVEPSETGSSTEREIDNASINKIFADEKARILAKREREAQLAAESGVAAPTAAQDPVSAPKPEQIPVTESAPAAPAPAPVAEPVPAPVEPSPAVEVTPSAPKLIFCRYCGKQIPGDSVFCSYCGKDVR
ncbi:MAG: zinc-ribbon domain-containing protein [Clostridiales bacterium]|nr:zinc-ribbon domain-containing protein [Clostridiales bacterium]